MEKLLTVEDVAEILQMEIATIYKMSREKRLPKIQFSRRAIRFRERDLVKFIEENFVPPVAIAQKKERQKTMHNEIKKKKQSNGRVRDSFLDGVIASVRGG